MRSKQTGVTLPELIIVIVIIGILAAITAPAFNDLLRTQRAKGAAESLVAALQNTKTQAIKANEVTRVVFKPSAINTAHSAWCYGMTDIGDTTCDCSVTPSSCAAGSVVDGDQYDNVTLTFNVDDTRGFEPVQGLSEDTGATIPVVIFDAGNNKKLGVLLNTIGRISVCRPTGTTISRYQDSGVCP